MSAVEELGLQVELKRVKGLATCEGCVSGGL